MTIVLAEDEPDIRLVARLALTRAGFDVRAVTNGREALAAIHQAPPDVVLLDWMMPEMDGAETCAQLKNDPAIAHVPVIFFTAQTDDATVAQGLLLGAIGHIKKPFDALTLGDRVRQLLRAN